MLVRIGNINIQPSSQGLHDWRAPSQIELKKMSLKKNLHLLLLKCYLFFSQPLTYWIQTAIMVGRQIILRNWKKSGEPPFQEPPCLIGCRTDPLALYQTTF